MCVCVCRRHCCFCFAIYFLYKNGYLTLVYVCRHFPNLTPSPTNWTNHLWCVYIFRLSHSHTCIQIVHKLHPPVNMFTYVPLHTCVYLLVAHMHITNAMYLNQGICFCLYFISCRCCLCLYVCVCLLVCGFFVVSFFLLVLHAWQTYECTFSILCPLFLLFFFSAFHLIVCHLSLPSSSSVNCSDCCFCCCCCFV